MSAAARGDLLLLLHAHLPYAPPEIPYHLEENWLYEAITATYLPLIARAAKVWHDIIWAKTDAVAFADAVFDAARQALDRPLSQLSR